MNTAITYIIAFILGVSANYFYAELLFKFHKKKGAYLPKILNDANCWTTADNAVYFYEKDPSYSIKITRGEDPIDPRFNKFPDKNHSTISWVEVKFNKAVLFGWNFMNLDGGRYLVPVPKTERRPDNSYYDYYDIHSIETKVFGVIGNANLIPGRSKIEGLKDIAGVIGITIAEL